MAANRPFRKQVQMEAAQLPSSLTATSLPPGHVIHMYMGFERRQVAGDLCLSLSDLL